MNKLTTIICLSAVAALAVGCAANSDDEVVSESESALGTVAYERVSCESWDGRYQTCRVNVQGGRITRIRVLREHSFNRCVQNSTFGFRSSAVWVDRGCEADFEVRIERSGGGSSSGGSSGGSSSGGPPGCGTLLRGQSLAQHQSVTSCNGRNVFIHQGDGNVVLYHDGRPVWSNNILDTNTRELAMQGDGNLVQYDNSGRARWATMTNGNSDAYLNVQDDCNAVVYDRFNRPLWATNTAGCF